MSWNPFSKAVRTDDPAPVAEAVADAAEPAKPPRTYTVGWLLNVDGASMIWDAPKPVRVETQGAEVRSVAQCPSVLDFDRRHFTVNCPIDLHLRIKVTGAGIDIKNMIADKSPIRPEMLQRWVIFQPREEWRHPDRPVLQFMTAYVFVSDDPVYLNQYPPVHSYTADTRPGIQISGRFPVDIWPRAVQWAFEWHDTSKDLIIKRGEPLFEVRFEGSDPAAPVRMVQAQKTPELEAYIASITGVTEFVGQTFSLFKNARERRPATLLVPKETGGAAQ